MITIRLPERERESTGRNDRVRVIMPVHGNGGQAKTVRQENTENAAALREQLEAEKPKEVDGLTRAGMIGNMTLDPYGSPKDRGRFGNIVSAGGSGSMSGFVGSAGAFTGMLADAVGTDELSASMWGEQPRNEALEKVFRKAETDAAIQDFLRRSSEKSYADAEQFANESEGSRVMAKKGLGAVGSTFVDLGVAGVQMAGDLGLGMLTGGSSLLPMGIRSFGGSALEASLAGADSDEQMMYGLASALKEVGTEKLSSLAGVFRKAFGRGVTDSLVETVIGKLGSTAFGRSVLRLFASMGGEGLEEWISGLLDPALKGLYNGQSVKENYSELDVAEVAYEGLIGAMLGTVGGMVSFPGDVSRERARMNAENADIGRNFDPILQTDAARYSFQEQKIPTYEELIAKPAIPIVDIRDGAEKGTFREQRQAILNSEETQQLFREPIKNLDTGELVFVTPATLTHSFHNMGAEQLPAIKHINDIIQNAVLTYAETSRKAPDDHTTGVYTLFAAVRTENGIQPVKVKVKEYYLEGQEVPEPVKLYFAQNGEMNSYASAYDNRVLVLENIEKEEVSSSAASTATKGVTADNHPSTSSEISIAELYELVNSEYAKYLPRKMEWEALRKPETERPGFVNNKYAAGVERGFTRRLDRLGKALGVSYVYDGSLGDGVNGMKQGNVIRLNPNANVNDGWIVAHETGHVMKTRATAEWGDLQAYLVQLDAKQTGRSQEDRTADIQKIYENHGQELTAEEAREEIACDMLGDILQDERLFDGFLRDVERGSVKPGVAQKIIDALRDILDRIRNGSAVQDAADDLGLTEQEIRRAMEKLSAAAKAAGGNENAASEGGGVKYSIKRTSTMTLSEQLKAYYNGKMASSDAFYFGQTPETLSAANLDALPLAFTIADFKKSTREKHNVPRRVLNNLLSDLETPLFAFVDGDRVGVVTADIDGDGKPLLVGIQQNVQMDADKVNAIRSVYGLDHPTEWLNNQIKAGKEFVLFDEKEANAFLYPYGYLASRKEGIRSLDDTISQGKENSNTPKTSIDETREYKRELERMKRRAEYKAEAEKIKRESAQLVGSARAELRAAVRRDVESRLRASGAPESMAEPLTRLLLEERITDAQRALLNAEPAAQEIMKQYAASEPEPVARVRAKLAAAEAVGVSRLLELAEAERTGYNAIKETDVKAGESYGREGNKQRTYRSGGADLYGISENWESDFGRPHTRRTSSTTEITSAKSGHRYRFTEIREYEYTEAQKNIEARGKADGVQVFFTSERGAMKFARDEIGTFVKFSGAYLGDGNIILAPDGRSYYHELFHHYEAVYPEESNTFSEVVQSKIKFGDAKVMIWMNQIVNEENLQSEIAARCYNSLCQDSFDADWNGFFDDTQEIHIAFEGMQQAIRNK